MSTLYFIGGADERAPESAIIHQGLIHDSIRKVLVFPWTFFHYPRGRQSSVTVDRWKKLPGSGRRTAVCFVPGRPRSSSSGDSEYRSRGDRFGIRNVAARV